MTMLRFSSILSLGLAITLCACGSAVDVGGDTDEGSSSGEGTSGTSVTTTSPGVTTAGSATSGTVTTASPTTGPAETGDDGSTGIDDGGFIMPDTGDETSVDPQPNGAQCSGADECESGYCYTIPQAGGVCSECLVDQDCGMGTCSLDAVGYAICTDGSQGVQCNTDEGCMGELVCTELIDTGGIFNASFCSECGPQLPCTDGQLCTPFYDLENLGGSFICADPGSVDNGQGCPIEGGEGVGEACASGHCGVAALLGFAELGVCGECSVDEDCPMDGQTCVPAEAGMGGLVPAFCE
ncbi:MAG: hypothetical protein ACE37F_21565 [Nannocystaceae bacterium]|nr:hypothetical protein [bacterium]